MSFQWAEPVTPARTEAEVSRLLEALEERSDVLDRDLEPALSRTEADYRVAYAKAQLRMSGAGVTVGQRDAQALVSVEPEYRAYMEAQGAAKGARERVQALRAQIQGATSLNASARYLAGGQ